MNVHSHFGFCGLLNFENDSIFRKSRSWDITILQECRFIINISCNISININIMNSRLIF